MLSECETEEDITYVLKLKEDFMNTYCYEEKNPNLMHELPESLKKKLVPAQNY